jgi:molecular chaperone DnaK
MSAILGIDLGTTNSSCAFFDGRDVVLIPNDRGSRTTPSVVALADNGDILVGESARNQALIHPGRTIARAKRLMGSGTRLPFGNRTLLPEDAAAAVLSSLKRQAEDYLNETVREAVITVPAYFSEAQRRATREAGARAGLEVKRLLNEPTAAAIAWAWSCNRTFGKDDSAKTVLVYDLGGGTFDVTVLSMRGGDCRVLSTCGDNALGGSDFDALLFERAVSVFERELGKGVLRTDPIARQQLADLVERAKIELSSRDSTTLVMPFAGSARGSHLSWNIPRDEFESLISPSIDATLQLVQQALEEAGLSATDVDKLVLSGGSSRIPYVKRLLSQMLGRNAEARVNPEEIVAYGAAVFGALSYGSLADDGDSLRVSDALSRSFGLEIDGNDFITIIPKNSPVPVSRKRMFTTVADDQPSVEIHVLQGESRRASDNLSLGRFLLSGIRPGRKGEPRIEVEFSIDSDEILQVRARDVDTGARHDVTIAAIVGSTEANTDRLQALAARVQTLAAAAAGDRSLQAELADAVAEAERVSREAGAFGGRLDDDRRAEIGAATVSLEAIVAELESRRSSGG